MIGDLKWIVWLNFSHCHQACEYFCYADQCLTIISYLL